MSTLSHLIIPLTIVSFLLGCSDTKFENNPRLPGYLQRRAEDSTRLAETAAKGHLMMLAAEIINDQNLAHPVLSEALAPEAPNQPSPMRLNPEPYLKSPISSFSDAQEIMIRFHNEQRALISKARRIVDDSLTRYREAAGKLNSHKYYLNNLKPTDLLGGQGCRHLPRYASDLVAAHECFDSISTANFIYDPILGSDAGKVLFFKQFKLEKEPSAQTAKDFQQLTDTSNQVLARRLEEIIEELRSEADHRSPILLSLPL